MASNLYAGPFEWDCPQVLHKRITRMEGLAAGANWFTALEARGRWANADVWIKSNSAPVYQPAVVVQLIATLAGIEQIISETKLAPRGVLGFGPIDPGLKLSAKGVLCDSWKVRFATGAASFASDVGSIASPFDLYLGTWGTESAPAEAPGIQNAVASSAFAAGSPAAAQFYTPATSPQGFSVRSVVISAHRANTASVWVGNVSTLVATQGLELGPGEKVTLQMVDLTSLWFVSAIAAQQISYLELS